MYLPDINVWLASAFVVHAHHHSARAWFDGLTDDSRYFFCRFTQQGFLRLANNPNAFPQVAVTQDVAWSLYDSFMADPRIEFAHESPNIETAWRQLTQRPQLSPQSWGDAYLAAFAQMFDFEIVTFDKGFAKYQNLRHTILS